MAKACEKEKASPLFGRRYEIQGELAVLSPLHVGDGEGGKIAGVGGRAGANSELPEVARVVVDCDGRPYLPATTVKGLLRRIGETTTEADALDLFGDIKSKAGGVMGALLPRGARMITPGATAGYPYVEATKKAGGALPEGVFVAARTAIDPFSGVAADTKLFFQQTVAPGARFDLRLTLIAGEDAERAAKRLKEMIAILCVLGAPEGVVCGRGKADGAGRLRLDLKSLRIYEKTIGEDGALHSERVTPSLAANAAQRKGRRFSFFCEGPFASLDSSWDPDKPAEEGKRNPPQLAYQRDDKDAPLALGSQLAGVLRARARWIEGRKALRNVPANASYEEAEKIVRAVDPTAGDDDAAKNEAHKRVVVTRADVKRLNLTPVERLFGVTGYAGLLQIADMKFSGGDIAEITSVKLDHFSGAPIDKALFTTKVVVGVRLEIALALEERRDADPEKLGHAGDADAAVSNLFNALIEDIRNNGLTLGHGANKGFGWFKFEKELSNDR